MSFVDSQPVQFPEDTGYYLWYVLDLNYTDVGLVQILRDNPKHLEYLRSLPPEKSKGFFLYQTGFNNGITHTMYHQASDHLPPLDKESNRPLVDGFIPFDFRLIGLTRRPLQWVPGITLPIVEFKTPPA